MSVRRFRQVFEDDDGCEHVFWCAAFESEAAREHALGGTPTSEISPALAPVADGARPPGRPSFTELIEAAVESIEAELEELPTLAARARRVLKRIAQEAEPAGIPSRDTVERFLRDRPTRQKGRKN